MFARALSIGAETMVMRFDPAAPMHERYRVEHDFLDPATGAEAVDDLPGRQRVLPLGVQLLRDARQGGDVYPIDYANACPDVALTSLHYYFPWAIQALVKWTVFCLVTGRQPRLDTDTRRYFEISDRSDLDYGQKLAVTGASPTSTSPSTTTASSAPRTWPTSTSGCSTGPAGPTFDRLLVDTVTSTYPEHEHERFIAHFRGLTGLWVRDEAGRLQK